MYGMISKMFLGTAQKLSSLTLLDHLIVFGISISSLLIGSWTDAMSLLILLQLIDVATGLTKGKREKKLSSSELKKGAKSKFGGWLYIIVGNAIDGLLTFGTPVAKTFVVSYLIVMELMSIVENAEELGAPGAPKFITKYLDSAKNQLDNGKNPNGKDSDTK